MSGALTVKSEWTSEDRTECRVLSGAFLVQLPSGEVRRIESRIVEWRGMPSDVYLLDPPRELTAHPHGPCWQLVAPASPAWFKLHWERPPLCFGDSRGFVEAFLDQAFTLAQERRTG